MMIGLKVMLLLPIEKAFLALYNALLFKSHIYSLDSIRIHLRYDLCGDGEGT